MALRIWQVAVVIGVIALAFLPNEVPAGCMKVGIFVPEPGSEKEPYSTYRKSDCPEGYARHTGASIMLGQ